MKIKHLCTIAMLAISFSSLGQLNAYLSGGVGSNSGALVYPYEEPNPFMEVPTLLEIGLEYQLSDTLRISFFGVRKVNTKSQGLFSGVNVDAKSHYLGLKYGVQIPNRLLKKSFFNLGILMAYGQESIDWKNTGGLNLFGGHTTNDDGVDQFHLAQIGVFASVRKEFRKFIAFISLEPKKDFVLSGVRKINHSTASSRPQYEDFNYKGVFSADLKVGIGIKLFGG